MPRTRWELGGVDAVLPLKMSEDGRLRGLKKFAGRRVYLVVPEDEADLDAKIP